MGTYGYSSAHPHAVERLDGAQKYFYDENGNMTRRIVGALTYDLAYDAENRLVSVTTSGGATPTPTPTATFTPTPTATFTPTPTATATFTPTPTQPADLIFADGFESGNLSAWSSSVTDGGDLSAAGEAALVGSYGLKAVADDIQAIYVVDDTPSGEARYRAHFHFDPNSAGMTSGATFPILFGMVDASNPGLRVEFRYYSGSYQVRARLLDDAGGWTSSSWFTISDAPHTLEVDWKAATAAGANNGYLTFWIDGTQQANLTGVDNDGEFMLSETFPKFDIDNITEFQRYKAYNSESPHVNSLISLMMFGRAIHWIVFLMIFGQI